MVGIVIQATTAIENGMVGSFLQTPVANTVRSVVDSAELSEYDRESLSAFLSVDDTDSDSDEYTPSSGQITGLLKGMSDTISKALDEKTKSEETSIALYEELMAAKTKEVEASTTAIEKKTVRVGELGVEIASMKGDLTDTEAALIEDQKFLKDMDSTCKQVTIDYEARQKTRSEELVAIADTIKILNDDDALELFKKTLPGSSLLEVTAKRIEMMHRALEIVNGLRKHNRKDRSSLDFLALSLMGKKVNFDKVIKMIDELVSVLKTEQQDDNHKKEYCVGQFDVMDDKKKGLERDLSDLSASIEDMSSSIKSITEDIASLEEGIKALDKSVAEATEQRKEEHEDYTALMTGNTAAKDSASKLRGLSGRGLVPVRFW